MKYQIDDTIYQTFIKNKAYYPRTMDDVNNINWFAGTFLMPPEIYKQIMNANTTGTTVNTKAIADYFQVPISFASWWGQTLGLLKRDFS